VTIFIPNKVNIKFLNLKIIHSKKIHLKGINPPTNTLYVTNISRKANRKKFLEIFEKHGTIVSYK